MMNYCDVCNKEVETKIITRKETFQVCGEDITVDAQVKVCADCGEELFCEELDSAALINAYNEYRRRHKLLFPEEIKKIREQYDLSQRSFAKLLNWGDKTIHRYENGAIPDYAHNSLLLFLREPANMRTYLTENEIGLDERQKAQLLDITNKLEQTSGSQSRRQIYDVFFSKIPCEENGFRGFDYEKCCAMVLFFANKATELLKTKLMKELYYSDKINYKGNGISISGLKYAHLKYGPVPDHFEILLERMTMDHIAHIEVFYNNGYESQQIVPDQEFPEGVLSNAEIQVLERIYNKFKNFGSCEISEYSHKEKGYKSTQPGEIISYAYAKDIELN